MDPVDILTRAVHAAQQIRSSSDPETILAGAYTHLGIDRPNDGEDPWSLRIVRLVETAGSQRDRLFDYLYDHAGPLPLNRPTVGWGGTVEPNTTTDSAIAEVVADEDEVEALLEYVEDAEDSGREMMTGMPAFAIADKSLLAFFGDRTVVVRNGERLPADQVEELQKGDRLEFDQEDLPTTVRVLLDYPLDRPALFTIEVGPSPWSVWHLCCAIADLYARIYEQPEHYGINAHDLTDLYIEDLRYFPQKNLIYPYIGS